MTETDFSKCPIDKTKMYGGQNGSKIGIIYKNENYMLKFPPLAKQNSQLHYANSCISEHVACQIFKTLGIETQDTILGTYKGKTKTVYMQSGQLVTVLICSRLMKLFMTHHIFQKFTKSF